MTHPSTNVWAETGLLRRGIPAAVNQWLQIDAYVSASAVNATYGLFGVRNGNLFNVNDTIAYAYINRDTAESLNITSYPAGSSVVIDDAAWIRLKLKIETNQVKIYVHAPLQGIDNELLATAPFTGIHSGSIHAQIHCARTTGSSYMSFKNYIVSDQQNAAPERARKCLAFAGAAA